MDYPVSLCATTYRRSKGLGADSVGSRQEVRIGKTPCERYDRDRLRHERGLDALGAAMDRDGRVQLPGRGADRQAWRGLFSIVTRPPPPTWTTSNSRPKRRKSSIAAWRQSSTLSKPESGKPGCTPCLAM